MSVTNTSFRELEKKINLDFLPLIEPLDKECSEIIEKNSPDLNKNLENLFTRQSEIEKKICEAYKAYKSCLESFLLHSSKYSKLLFYVIHINQGKERMDLIREKMRPFENFRQNGPRLDLSRRDITQFPNPAQMPSLSFTPIGLYNEAANCAFNSIIQFLAHIPSLKNACDLLPSDFDELKHMLQLHREDEEAGRSLSRVDSQKLRLLMHHLFQEEIFSASPNKQEDAYEMLMCILGRIPNPQQQSMSNLTPLYSTINTTRRYGPTGKIDKADPLKVELTRLAPNSKDAYSILDENCCSKKMDDDCQIIIDLNKKGHLPFEALFREFFINRNVIGSATAFYLEKDDQLHEYSLLEETKEFALPPSELLIALKRFELDIYGQRTKINTPVAVPLYINLPPEASASHEAAWYELDGVVQHRGNSPNGGHYVAYLKINGKWIEYDDINKPRELSNNEIKIALQNTYFHHYRRINRMPIIETPSQAVLDLSKAVATGLEISNKIEKLKALLKVLNDDTIRDNDKLKIEFYKQSTDLIDDIHYIVWLNGGVKDIYDYGRKECDANIRLLKDINKPWLSKHGSNIVEQLLHIHEQKEEIANLNKAVKQLKVFLEMLKDPEITNTQLKEAIYKLDYIIDGAQICHKFHELVYKAHQVDEDLYGKKATDGNVRLLLQINKPLLSLSGGNLVEQMIHHVNLKIDQVNHAYFKDQLEAFHMLLTDPAISNAQLEKIFEGLEPDIKEKLYLSVWVAHNYVNIPKYGENTIKANVRGLLDIKAPVLSSAGGDIVQQLTSLFT